MLWIRDIEESVRKCVSPIRRYSISECGASGLDDELNKFGVLTRSLDPDRVESVTHSAADIITREMRSELPMDQLGTSKERFAQ